MAECNFKEITSTRIFINTIEVFSRKIFDWTCFLKNFFDKNFLRTFRSMPKSILSCFSFLSDFWRRLKFENRSEAEKRSYGLPKLFFDSSIAFKTLTVKYLQIPAGFTVQLIFSKIIAKRAKISKFAFFLN